ncbi:MAG: ParB/RepB/Spo0J family partition protein [Candidatus Paceibacterota bacterium]
MEFYNNSIFWIEVEKIKPNPFQPRKEFEEARLRDLASSIRQYGILQPLVVTRKEIHREDGSMFVEYELISGERRLRASKLAGLTQVPAIIRTGEQTDRVKLELAIIENLQREDLNAIDRAKSFKQLADQFNLKHTEIAEKIGKSREYVSNTLRLLLMPEEMQLALSMGKISEGHTRPLLMLIDRKEEQMVLFKEIMQKKMTVREAEGIARRIAYDKVRKKEHFFSPEIVELEERLTEALGTRVQIEAREAGGKIHIDYFNDGDLRNILELIKKNFDEKAGLVVPAAVAAVAAVSTLEDKDISQEEQQTLQNDVPKQEEEETYNLDNFVV